MVTKFQTRDYVADIYHHKNRVNPVFANIYAKYTPKTSHVYVFQHFRKSTGALVGLIFAFNTSCNVVLRKVVPLWGEKN